MSIQPRSDAQSFGHKVKSDEPIDEYNFKCDISEFNSVDQWALGNDCY